VSNKVFIDTLFVVALINQRDAYHDKATELANEYEDESFYLRCRAVGDR